MYSADLIPVTEFCIHYHIDERFIESLCEYGMAELVIVEEGRFLEADQIPGIEKMIRLHHDLEINLEGLDVINGLLQKIETLQQEINLLRKQLPGRE